MFCKTFVDKDDNVLLFGKLLEIVCFDRYYHAFKVRLHPDKIIKVLHINCLFYFKPFDVQIECRMADSTFFKECRPLLPFYAGQMFCIVTVHNKEL